MRAEVLATAEKPTEALATLDEGIQRLPNDPEIWNDKAVFLEKAKRFDQASEAYSRAIEFSETATSWSEEKKAIYLLNRSDLFASKAGCRRQRRIPGRL